MRRILTIGVLTLVWVVPSVAQQRERSAVPEQYRWDLTPLFSSDADWRAARDRVEQDVPRIAQFKGKLGTSAATLADALEAETSLNEAFERVSTYASLLADQDRRDATHEGMRQQTTRLGSALWAAASYIQPEILRIAPDRLEQMRASEPRLAPYRMYFDNIIRRRAHTLDDAQEALLATAGPLSQASQSSFEVLTTAELPYPTVKLADGRAVTLDQAAFAGLRASASRADRQTVMKAFFDSLGQFKGTLGSTMAGNLQSAVFYAKAEGYSNDLDAVLDRPNLARSVYTRLIDGINQRLATFHRYLRLRKRILGVDQLHYYDLYAPLVADTKLNYTPEEAQRNIVAAVAPLGQDYTATIQRAFRERWIDFYPNIGKASGGYTASTFGVHPFVLLNYNGQYVDMSTVAHELGHAMHSHLSQREQPPPMAGHAIFVAEVASLFNEALLKDYMVTQIADRNARLSVLGNYLEVLKANVFRQTQFAEFELRMHEMAERGDPVTGESLSKLYLDITRRYYGHDQGVCIVDDYVASEWSMIPHFYRPFYVFQYATSFTAATALAEKVTAGGGQGAEATRRYLAFLGSGGSKYPVDLLKDAGVDMTVDEPLDLTMRNMNRVMDEMEALIK